MKGRLSIIWISVMLNYIIIGTVTLANTDNGIWLTREIMELSGEIKDIDAHKVVLSSEKGDFKIIIDPWAQIYCNGLKACWQALKPVTPQAYFEARVVLNKAHQISYIEGFYEGEECIIESWWKCQEKLGIELSPIYGSSPKWKWVKNGARLPAKGWLVRGQLVYVLYNREGKVRGVYLPE